MAEDKKRGSGPLPAQVFQSSVEDVIHDSMIPYAEYVIMERALPRVEDGLKPVQRRLLFTMHELSLVSDKPHRKCAKTVGDCLARFHPHGDASVYGSLVRMAQPFSLREPLVDGHGNFGSIDGDPPAAMRYTEARMTPLSELLLADIEKDTVPFRLNYDDTCKEPDMLPAYFPNLLVNGADGIAVGVATNIPPHNLEEVVSAVIALIENPDATIEELMRYIPAPDFPTGGVLIQSEEIQRAYETGRGKLVLRARVHIEDGASGRKRLVITQVPYQVSKSAMLEKILKLFNEKKAALGGCHDIRDESDRTGMRAVIELKKDADPNRVLAYLYKYSDLQITFGVNMVAIADGKPVLMGLRELLERYITHQKNVVTRRTRYDLDEALRRMHILEGLMIALDNLDEVIRIIRASRNPKAARDALVDTFALSETQAQAILDMRLQRLTHLETLALRREHAEKRKLVERLEAILNSKTALLNVIKGELRDVAAEYHSPRRTMVETETITQTVQIDEGPEPEEAVVFYSHGGYLRRMHPRMFEKKTLPDPMEGMQEQYRYIYNAMTDDTLLFFTNKGNCYAISVGSLPEMNRPQERGQLLAGILNGLEKEETLTALFLFKPGELSAGTDFLFITERGMIKRAKASEYDIKRSKFNALTLKDKDALLTVLTVPQTDDLLLISRHGMSIRFRLDSVSVMGRTAGGVRVMQLDGTDRILAAAAPDPSMSLLLMSDRGYAKRLLMSDFDCQNRNGKGVHAFNFNKNGSNGTCLVAALPLPPDAVNLFVYRTQSPACAIMVNEVAFLPKTGKGRPYVAADTEDSVTCVLPVN